MLTLAPQKSAQVAMGGIFSSLCLFIMLMSAVIPFSSFALPMLAGIMLAVVVIENGSKTAFLVYISVSLLSLFIVPDLETKLMFIMFFGYYAIIRPQLEKAGRKAVVIFLKLLILNVSMVIVYYLSLKLTGLDEAAGDSEIFNRYAPAVLLLGMNFCFVVYDFVLTKYTALYVGWFRPTFLRR